MPPRGLTALALALALACAVAPAGAIAPGKVIELTDVTFDAEVAKGPTLVEVYADWCSCVPRPNLETRPTQIPQPRPRPSRPPPHLTPPSPTPFFFLLHQALQTAPARVDGARATLKDDAVRVAE